MKIKVLIILLLLFLGGVRVSSASNMPLEIINIKPAGTGNPAIPASHRIFYAYPGIEYKIRAAVIGGDYPYSFTLSNAPSGMTVDTAGYIRWPNPQASADNITLRVIDSSGNYVDTTWSISIQTVGFRFVDINSATNGDGSINSPFNSIGNMAAVATPMDFIYFRQGTYQLPTRGDHTIENASAFEWDDPSDTATRWLSYPGEMATIDLGNNRYFLSYTDVPFYFDNLTFRNGREYFFRTNGGGGESYVTFLDNTFDTLTIEREDYNSNQGAYFTDSSNTVPRTGWYLTFQGNNFINFSAQSIGSLYYQSKSLIENNYLSDFTNATTSINQAVALKVGIQYLTFRGNDIYLNDPSWSGIFGGSTNSGLATQELDGDDYTSHSLEFCFNRLHSAAGGIRFNAVGGNPIERQLVTWFYRNTVTADLTMTNIDYPDACAGPWLFDGNVFQNINSGLSTHYTNGADWMDCLTYTDNLGATTGLVDTDGMLTPSFSSYLGQAGWQFEDGTTPMDGVYSPEPDTTSPSAPGGLGVL